jgi:hypothetical protein
MLTLKEPFAKMALHISTKFQQAKLLAKSLRGKTFASHLYQLVKVKGLEI